MRRGFKKTIAFAGAAAMALSLTACGGGSGSAKGSNESSKEGAAKDEVTSVNVHIPTAYDLPDAQLVEDEINKITEDKYKLHLDLNFISTGNWLNQSNLLFTGDEADVIAVYSTPLTTYVRNGQLADLTDYYNSSTEEMKGIWSEAEINGTSVNGKIYAIPNMRNFGNYFGVTVDKDIAAEYGWEAGQKITFEDLDKFLADMHEKYPDRYGLAPQGGDTLIGQWSWDGLGDTKMIGVLPDQGQSTEVQNLFDTDDFQDFCNWAHKWYQDGYIMKDILSNTEPWQGMIRNKKAVAALNNYGPNKLEGMINVVILDKWVPAGNYQDLCYGISMNSKKKDAAWKAMEILYTDKEVGILLNNGIEGKHYVKNEDGTISIPDGKSAADCGYGMSELNWITPYSANSYPLQTNGADYFEKLKDFNASTLKSKANGFFFDNTEVADQYTACCNVMDKYYKALMSGAVDVESTVKQANEELKAAGIDDIIKAKQEQLDAFFAQQTK
ncbi:ABC transporter substrate-binding protein [Murimonas intestini]|uniref:ABC transporter substrate-binding protein n=1 Tax=Murimonas intestini TaxID=1337051 RepID=UPI00165277D6|nr:ABC transporter substrate-binding protein [Murimonas intestini]